MSRWFYKFMTRKAAFIVGMCGTVKRYELQKHMNRKILKKELNNNQVSNIQFLNSFKERSRGQKQRYYSGQMISTTKGFCHECHRLSNGGLKTSNNRPDQDQVREIACKMHGYTINDISCDSQALLEKKRSVTLPVLNHETDTPGRHASSDELMRNLKKINNGVKHLLNRDTEVNIVANEWKLVGLIMDRLIFWTFFSVTCCCSGTLLIVLPILKHSDLI